MRCLLVSIAESNALLPVCPRNLSDSRSPLLSKAHLRWRIRRNQTSSYHFVSNAQIQSSFFLIDAPVTNSIMRPHQLPNPDCRCKPGRVLQSALPLSSPSRYRLPSDLSSSKSRTSSQRYNCHSIPRACIPTLPPPQPRSRNGSRQCPENLQCQGTSASRCSLRVHKTLRTIS